MSDNNVLTTYTEEFTFYDADDNEVPPHFDCSVCGVNVDEEPCPDHAPKDVPGLRLAECWSEPRHWIYAHQREDYGFPCPMCLLKDFYERDAETRRCRHWGWRRSRMFRWLAAKAYSLGVVSATCTSTCDGCNWCVTLYPRGKRQYILGVSRNTWNCWRRGHRRGEDAGLGGPCGKCVPWSCCGSERFEHNAGCVEANA